MIERFRLGEPIKTDSTVKEIPFSNQEVPFFEVREDDDGICFSYELGKRDKIYGLGEQVRGINKRGWIYESYCRDETYHTEGKHSLYGAHNFLIIDGRDTFLVFFDYPGKVIFDLGYTDKNKVKITMKTIDMDCYFITENMKDRKLERLVSDFRELIGTSYIPPLWAFGYQQSRWGYQNEEDILEVMKKHREQNIPLDAIYLDIDYMERFKDFTIHPERFPSMKKLVQTLKKEHIHIVPIIDAGVKVEKGYEVYEQGLEKGYFCEGDEGIFTAGVWPGLVHFTDFMNPKAAKWFGDFYKPFLEMGIEGFWNDMNEPALFYSLEGLKEVYEASSQMSWENFDLNQFLVLQARVNELANKEEDHKHFYHQIEGRKVSHDKVHNLYGYYMTRAAKMAMEEYDEKKRTLLFSRASYIGMHRYAGIWTGDNKSWWSHLKLLVQMLPSLNMCGFLYTGADIGGFDDNVTEDLLMRWMAFTIFVPLMRNHSAISTRRQEVYQFGSCECLKGFIKFRYRLIPFLYSEFVKAALQNKMYIKPLSFAFEEDEMACIVEDEVLLGDTLLLAPVYEQNALGRYIYLPEDMKEVRVNTDGKIKQKVIEKGHHYLEAAEEELVFFIRKNRMLVLGEEAEWVSEAIYQKLTILCYIEDKCEYLLYQDDGISTEYEKEEHFKKICVERNKNGELVLTENGGFTNISILE